MRRLWLQLFSKGRFEQTCCLSSWRKKLFKCTICDARFSQQGHLNGHIASVHEEKKPFKFTICDASFAQKLKLESTHIISSWEKESVFDVIFLKLPFQKKANKKNSLHQYIFRQTSITMKMYFSNFLRLCSNNRYDMKFYLSI